MHVIVLGYLVLVIVTCSVGALIYFATSPLRISFSRRRGNELDIAFGHRFPYSRLLDRLDFDYLRSVGWPGARLRKFRAQRRKIARSWLRTVAADFNRADHALMLLLAGANVDRPDLASIIIRQRVILCCHFVRAEAQLVLDVCGYSSSPFVEPFETLETLCTRMRTLAGSVQPAGSTAC